MRVAPLEKPRLGRHKPSSFPPNRSPKTAGTKHFMFGGRFGVSQTGAVTGCAALWRIFSSRKELREPIGRKDSIQAVCRRMRRLDGFLYEAEKKLWTLYKNSRSKLKNLKPIVVDVLSQTYPMVSLSYRSKLYRRHTGRRRKRDNLRTGEGGGVGDCEIIRQQDSLVLHKSFNTLWINWSVVRVLKTLSLASLAG